MFEGLGVARHRVLIDCNGEHRDRAQDRGVWVVRTKCGKQLAARAKILNALRIMSKDKSKSNNIIKNNDNNIIN